jgi:molybdopterin adenylyltransferase
MYSLGIVTSSDKGFKKEREDESGKIIRSIAESLGFEVKKHVILPDEQGLLEKEFIHMSDDLKLNLILSTGGTGFSKRDVTPEATKNIIEKEAPGIAEAMRMHSIKITKRAMLSRAIAGIRKDTLIVNLPGSPKACREILEYILDDLKHGIDILCGGSTECARK